MTHVVVIGGGASGTAAAFAAVQEGAKVTLFSGRPGATAQTSGALDGEAAGIALSALEARFHQALGVWARSDAPCLLGTCSGVLRWSAGRDRALVDLAASGPGLVAVVDVERRGWDATALARAWTREPLAVERGLHFEPIPVSLLQFADEEILPTFDLALRHDDKARLRFTLEQLREAAELRNARAVVVGPWLGVESQIADALTRELGVPVGEPLASPSAVAGGRFERARDRWLLRSGVAVEPGMVASVSRDDNRIVVNAAGNNMMSADAVVLCVGGLAGGGLRFRPEPAAKGFELSLAVEEAELALGRRPLRGSGSPEGALFEAHAWNGGQKAAGIERVGIWADEQQKVRCRSGAQVPGLYAAGDIAADRPRTLLEAIRAGLVAGAAAARV